MNWKWKNKNLEDLQDLQALQDVTVDHRIPVLQVARFSRNRQKEGEIWIEKNGCRLGSNCQVGW